MAMIAGAAGLAGGAAGSEANNAATVEGAQTQADIEAMNRAYQRKLFDEQQANQQPYYQAGYDANPLLNQFRTQGGIDLSNNPLFQMQQRLGSEGLQMAGQTRPGTQEYFNAMNNATSQTPAYQRLLDLQKVGLGSADTAGSYANNQGNALASSYMTGGNAMASGAINSGHQRQSLYSNLAGGAANLPAYLSYNNAVGGQR